MGTHKHSAASGAAEAGDTEGRLVSAESGKMLPVGSRRTAWEGDD